jgi:NADH-quinone oxidoreductase subunit C
MDSTGLAALLGEVLPDAAIEAVPAVDLHATCYVGASDAQAVLRAMYEHPDLRFTLLIELTGVDYWPRDPRFEIVYTLVSLEHAQRARLKVRLRGDAARLPSVSGLFPAANWLEREVWDLFGIEFQGHPDPRRLLMPEDWEGFPLRKDYPVQIVMKPRTSEPLQVSEEEFRANLTRDRLART